MLVPDFQSLMLPALKSLSGGKETRIYEVRERVATTERLSPEDVKEMLPSGKQSVFVNRVSWAIFHMKHAGLLERVRHSVYRLTQEGEQLLSQKPTKIDIKLLSTFSPYADWLMRTDASQSDKDAAKKLKKNFNDTPLEALIRATEELRISSEFEVLDLVRSNMPDFLEKVVIDLLIAMGYGGGDERAARVTGGSGDGGIDGTIREDALGLDEVYIQAKKYAEGNTVGQVALQNFAGAIDAAGTTKGVFVTTSSFTQAAKKYVELSPKRIVLIDGKELAKLMVEYNIGVSIRDRYVIKKIDESYFDEEGI